VLGTDALWTGSPQWQIEVLRRLEIPRDMQKKFGFARLGPADGLVKTAIFGGSIARLYGVQGDGTWKAFGTSLFGEDGSYQVYRVKS
jgi:hypothetical protein